MGTPTRPFFDWYRRSAQIPNQTQLATCESRKRCDNHEARPETSIWYTIYSYLLFEEAVEYEFRVRAEIAVDHVYSNAGIEADDGAMKPHTTNARRNTTPDCDRVIR